MGIPGRELPPLPSRSVERADPRQLALGTWLISGSNLQRRTATAGTVYHDLMRIDGAKMFPARRHGSGDLSAGPNAATSCLAGLAPAGVALAAAGDVRAGLLAACSGPCLNGHGVGNPAGGVRRCNGNHAAPLCDDGVTGAKATP